MNWTELRTKYGTDAVSPYVTISRHDKLSVPGVWFIAEVRAPSCLRMPGAQYIFEGRSRTEEGAIAHALERFVDALRKTHSALSRGEELKGAPTP